MDKDTAIAIIDKHKNALINPVDMLNWTWLRVIILNIPNDQWSRYVSAAEEMLSS